MARHKVHSEISDNGLRLAHVYRDSDWNEYQVEFEQNGRISSRATYHTDDKEDALITASSYVHYGLI